MSAEKAWQEELAYLRQWSAIYEKIQAKYDEWNLGSHNPAVTFGMFVDMLISIGLEKVKKMNVTEVLEYYDQHRVR